MLARWWAIETARAGGASGEANAVLRTLPEVAARQVPLRVRHPSTIAAAIGVIALVAVAIVLLAVARAHDHGGGAKRMASSTVVERVVNLATATAVAYNPFGSGIDHPADAALVLDDKAGTFWRTNHYLGGNLGKPGVGVYLSEPRQIVANRLVLATPTPGFNVQVWGADRIGTSRPGEPQKLVRLGWRLLGGARKVARSQTVALSGTEQGFRYYLLWITKLEPAASAARTTRAEVASISMQRAVRVGSR
jgi:hypothetical protein